VTYSLRRAPALSAGVVLVHAQGELKVLTGHGAGEHTSTITLVLVRTDQDAEWRIALFHNTLVTPPG
jgi:hypothetical protein